MSHHTRNNQGYLAGKLLLATPDMRDPRFARSVVLLCQHNVQGAMGIIINKPLPKLPFKQVMQQFNLRITQNTPNHVMHFGGPVETSRGFVLHGDDYSSQHTETISSKVNVTATIDVIRHIASGDGPQQCLMALGYASWSGGQLEQELQVNAWLVTHSTTALLFDMPSDERWDKAYQQLGLNPAQFISHAGSA